MTTPWYSHKKIEKHLYHIDDNKISSIYLLNGDNHSVLFDTGLGIYDLKSYVSLLTNNPLTVFNTHCHLII